MPTPYDLYLRFLATKGFDELGEVNARLEELALPAVELPAFQAQLAVATTQVSPGVLRQIEAKSYSASFLPEMKVLGVDEFWRAENGVYGVDRKDPLRAVVRLVLDIHEDQSLRLMVNALLMKGVPNRDIVQSANYRFASMLREEHVVLYRKYFWAVETMTRGAWRAFLRRVPDHEKLTYLTALTEPLDVLKSSLELPAKHSTSDTLQYLLTKSTVKAKRLLDDETPEGRKECREWIDTVLKLTSSFEKFRAGDQADFGKSLQLVFKHVETEFAEADPELMKELAAKQRKPKEEAAPPPPATAVDTRAPEPVQNEDSDEEEDESA